MSPVSYIVGLDNYYCPFVNYTEVNSTINSLNLCQLVSGGPPGGGGGTNLNITQNQTIIENQTIIRNESVPPVIEPKTKDIFQVWGEKLLPNNPTLGFVIVFVSFIVGVIFLISKISNRVR